MLTILLKNTWVQLSFPGYKRFENMQKNKKKKKKTWNRISFSSWNIHVPNEHFEIRYLGDTESLLAPAAVRGIGQYEGEERAYSYWLQICY